MTDPVIDILALTKTYRTGFMRTPVHAVKNLALTVARGSIVAFVPALVTVLEHDTSSTRRVIGRALGVATPPGFEDHYIRVPRMPDEVVRRSAALRRRRAPVDPSAQRKILAETGAFTAIYLLAGCVAFGRRDVKV